MKKMPLPVAPGSAVAPTDPNALYALSSDPGNASTVFMGSGYNWVALDPVESSPNALVAVQTAAGVFALTPGRMIPIGVRETRLLVWNVVYANWGAPPDQAYTPVGGSYGRLGRGALVFGTAAEAVIFQSLQTAQPAPKAQVLFQSVVSSLTPCWFIAANLHAVRISARAADAGSNVIAAPADFAVTLRLYHRFNVPQPPVGSSQPFALDGDVLGRARQAAAGNLIAQSSLDFVLSDQDNTRDFQVLIPTPVMSIVPQTIAGTGVVNVSISVEGC